MRFVVGPHTAAPGERIARVYGLAHVRVDLVIGLDGRRRVDLLRPVTIELGARAQLATELDALPEGDDVGLRGEVHVLEDGLLHWIGRPQPHL